MNQQLGLNNQAPEVSKSSATAKVRKTAAMLLLVTMLSTTSRAQSDHEKVETDTIYTQYHKHHTPAFAFELTKESFNVSDEGVILNHSPNTSLQIGGKHLPGGLDVSIYEVINTFDINNGLSYIKLEGAKEIAFEKFPQWEAEAGLRVFFDQDFSKKSVAIPNYTPFGLFADIKYESMVSHTQKKGNIWSFSKAIGGQHIKQGKREGSAGVGYSKEKEGKGIFKSKLWLNYTKGAHKLTGERLSEEETIDPSLSLQLGYTTRHIPLFKSKYGMTAKLEIYKNLLSGHNPTTSDGVRFAMSFSRK